MQSKNRYYLLRHGEAISNVKQIVSSWPEKFKNPLTDNGRKQVKDAAVKLLNKHIDLIFSSDLLRTRQTAEIVGRALKIKPKFDKRLREVGFGGLNGRPAEELLYLKFEEGKLNHIIKKSEGYADVLKRVSEFLQEIDGKYKVHPVKSRKAGISPKAKLFNRARNILIVSHQCPLWILENHINGFSLDEGLKRIPKEKRISKGEIRELN